MTIENSNLSISDFSQPENDLSTESERFITLSAPITLQWETTPWCNEQCIHCYNYWRKSPNLKPNVTKETTEIWNKITSEIIQNKVFHTTITGGEPLSVFRQIYPYLEKLTDNNVNVAMNSNLTMLTTEKAHLLKEIGIKSVLTSF